MDARRPEPGLLVALTTGLTGSNQEEVMGYAQQMYWDGEQVGRQKGREEGREEEARRMLRQLLVRRFGPLPAHLLTRLDAADVTTLETWADGLLECTSAEELLGA